MMNNNNKHDSNTNNNNRNNNSNQTFLVGGLGVQFNHSFRIATTYIPRIYHEANLSPYTNCPT
jgi:hypothetical protein